MRKSGMEQGRMGQEEQEMGWNGVSKMGGMA